MKKVFIFATLMTMVSPVYADFVDVYDFIGMEKICSKKLNGKQYVLGKNANLGCDGYGATYSSNQIMIPVYNHENKRIGEAAVYILKSFDSNFSYKDDGKFAFSIRMDGVDLGLMRNVTSGQDKMHIIASETELKNKISAETRVIFSADAYFFTSKINSGIDLNVYGYNGGFQLLIPSDYLSSFIDTIIFHNKAKK